MQHAKLAVSGLQATMQNLPFMDARFYFRVAMRVQGFPRGNAYKEYRASLLGPSKNNTTTGFSIRTIEVGAIQAALKSAYIISYGQVFAGMCQAPDCMNPGSPRGEDLTKQPFQSISVRYQNYVEKKLFLLTYVKQN